MAVTRRKTDEVLASAREELEVQLGVVRGEMKRLAAEEAALTQALSSIDGNSASTRSAVPSGERGGRSRAATKGARKSSTRTAGGGRRRARGAAGKSTAERVQELQGLLAGGPKSRKDLAAALRLSPARVQQLLGELGSSVTSQPDPEQRRGKLWSLKGRANGASAAKPAAKRSARASTRARARRPSARKGAAAK